MNSYVRSKKYLALMFAAIIALTAFVAVADSSDAKVVIDTNGISDSNFKQDREGTLHVPVSNPGDTASVTLTVTENGNLIKQKTFEEVKNGTTTLDISFSLSKGDHEITIIAESNGETSTSSHIVSVKENVLSNITTYVAIAAIIIIVLIIAVVYIRANPGNKPTTTFTELEKEKTEAKAAEKSGEKSESAPSTGKIKYTSSRRK